MKHTTPAEARFKAVVRDLVRRGIYPAPAACGAALGRATVLRSLCGRETRWRRQVLNALRWRERPVSEHRRFSWVPPRAWRLR